MRYTLAMTRSAQAWRHALCYLAAAFVASTLYVPAIAIGDDLVRLLSDVPGGPQSTTELILGDIVADGPVLAFARLAAIGAFGLVLSLPASLVPWLAAARFVERHGLASLRSYALVGTAAGYAATWIVQVLLVFAVEPDAFDGPGRVLAMASAEFLRPEVQLAALAMGAVAGAVYWLTAPVTGLIGVRRGG